MTKTPAQAAGLPEQTWSLRELFTYNAAVTSKISHSIALNIYGHVPSSGWSVCARVSSLIRLKSA